MQKENKTTWSTQRQTGVLKKEKGKLLATNETLFPYTLMALTQAWSSYVRNIRFGADRSELGEQKMGLGDHGLQFAVPSFRFGRASPRSSFFFMLSYPFLKAKLLPSSPLLFLSVMLASNLDGMAVGVSRGDTRWVARLCDRRWLCRCQRSVEGRGKVAAREPKNSDIRGAGQSLLPAGLSFALTLPSPASFFLIVCQVFLVSRTGLAGDMDMHSYARWLSFMQRKVGD